MTARKPRRADRDNTSAEFTGTTGGVQNTDAQDLLEYLDRVDERCFKQLAGWSRLPHAYIKRLLGKLEADCPIETTQGHHQIRIIATATETSDSLVATDGGHIPGDGHSDLDVDVEIGLEADDVYRVLGSERRRRAIRILSGVSALGDLADADCSEYVQLSDLTDALVERQHEGSGTHIDSACRNSIYNSLSQTHLPLLSELGLIEYHERPQKIKPTPLIRQAAQLLDFIDGVATCHGPRPDRDIFASVLREGN